MTHLTSGERVMVKRLRSHAETFARWEGPGKGDTIRWKRLAKQHSDAADAIEQRAALAGQVVVLREKAELLEWLIKSRQNANLTATNKQEAVEFTLTVKELYGPWSYEECEWDAEQILNALRAAKEASDE